MLMFLAVNVLTMVKFLAAKVLTMVSFLTIINLGVVARVKPSPCRPLFPLRFPFHINIRGLRSHRDELQAVLDLRSPRPTIVFLNETFLDASVESVNLPGYALISRKDRDARGGGIAVFVSEEFPPYVTFLEHSFSFPTQGGQVFPLEAAP